MRKINTVLAALLILGIAACSTNSDKKVDLTGKWKLTDLDYNYSGTMTVDDEPQPVNITGHAINLDENDYIILGKDSSFTSSMNDVVVEMTLKSSDKTITEKDTLSDGEIFGTGTWTKNGDSLTVAGDDNTTGKFQITKLTHDNLTLKTDSLRFGPDTGDFELTIKMKK
jgi:hypothetical protein